MLRLSYREGGGLKICGVECQEPRLVPQDVAYRAPVASVIL